MTGHGIRLKGTRALEGNTGKRKREGWCPQGARRRIQAARSIESNYWPRAAKEDADQERGGWAWTPATDWEGTIWWGEGDGCSPVQTAHGATKGAPGSHQGRGMGESTVQTQWWEWVGLRDGYHVARSTGVVPERTHTLCCAYTIIGPLGGKQPGGRPWAHSRERF